MSTASERIYDSLIQHQMLLLKYFKSKQKEMLSILDDNNDKLLYEIYTRLKGMTKSLSKAEQERWQSLYKKVSKLRSVPIQEFKDKFKLELSGTIDREFNYILDLLQTEVPLELEYKQPENKDKIIPFALIYGKSFEQWFNEFEYKDSKRIQNAISNGFSQGLTADEIIQSIEGKKSLRYNDGKLQQSRKDAVDIIQTLGVGVAGLAVSMFMQANNDKIVAWRYEAILDGRTTLFCANHDGLIYEITILNAPYPPNHNRCRSRAVYIFSIDLVGNKIVSKDRAGKTQVIDFRKEAKYQNADKWKSYTETTKKSYINELKTSWFNNNIGSLPTDIKYPEWFAKQPASFQKTYLGKSRYELYSKGGLKFNQFVDFDGDTITLNDLYKIYPNEFNAAGLHNANN